MSQDPLLLALDQGTTSTRAMLFDRKGRPRARAQVELPQSFPHPGWVEHDAERIREDAVAVCRNVLERAAGEGTVAALGITNQRETTVLWERSTGRPVHPAIVWQDRRTGEACRRLRERGMEPEVRARTGLLLDPYFSATKLAWLLEEVDGAREAAERGDLAFGTIDTWLLWNLTGGRVHATDVTNASRTLLFDIHREVWDEDLLEMFDIPRAVLPEVMDSAGPFGEADRDLLGASLPILGIAGDQQAATFGQAAFRPGMIKGTYGTGCFVLLNTGGEAVRSGNRLLTTIAWRLDGHTTYALEGSIFVAGAAVQWLRDALGAISSASETEALAESIDDTGGVYLVPAFVGLGAPHWDSEARGALLGLRRESGVAEMARAALEAVAYQTRDLMEAMGEDAGVEPLALRVDGGLASNDWAMQFLSDMLALPVERPQTTETTALGAAYLAGLAAGVFEGLDDIAANWRRERAWEPEMTDDRREALYRGWRESVERVLTGPRDRTPDG